MIEGRHGVLVVGRHEDDVAAPAGLARHLQAGGAGHLDVEEDHGGLELVEQAQGLHAVLGLADDQQFGPQPGELFDQVLAQRGFIFGHDGGGWRVHRGRFRVKRVQRPPSASRSSSQRRPARPS